MRMITRKGIRGCGTGLHAKDGNVGSALLFLPDENSSIHKALGLPADPLSLEKHVFSKTYHLHSIDYNDVALDSSTDYFWFVHLNPSCRASINHGQMIPIFLYEWDHPGRRILLIALQCLDCLGISYAKIGPIIGKILRQKNQRYLESELEKGLHRKIGHKLPKKEHIKKLYKKYGISGPTNMEFRILKGDIAYGRRFKTSYFKNNTKKQSD